MRKDYDILEIEENADKKAIKKAYFKLIREYTPEKDPERFQQIRASYERLMEEIDHPENNIQLEFPKDDSFAKSMYDQIQQSIYDEDYSKALRTAEEGARSYNEVECFLYMVAKCSILNDNSGKAVKAYEKLVERYPDKIMYKGELARAYYMRGYTNKAYKMFGEAYAQGWREYNFLSDYSACCGNRKKVREGIDILKRYIESVPEQEIKNNIAEIMDAYVGMFMLALDKTDEMDEVAEGILSFLDQIGDVVLEYEEMISSLYIAILLYGYSKSERMKILEDRLSKMLSKMPEMEGMGAIMQLFKINTDIRFGSLLQYTIEVLMEINGMEYDTEEDYADFLFTDLILCHLEEWPAQKGEIKILQEEYSDVYDMGSELWKILGAGAAMRSQLKNECMAQYAKMERKFPGEGQYYVLYPEKRQGTDQIQWDSMEEGTFVRNERKIGRNESCPCGSGKKYKNCCGKGK